ncbi:ribosome maturation factor RimM [Buchnera aphidicola (Muscaphis stroyani)]|uniref:Ribosome maturation factor RimM n=1 Tax=Buchnera aphidicola (Muscaphis stroyani) TaxID=1241869 RepID=A0A4D6YFL7_9GAMM|nr:ribosome maturation factor RimM [Buchnera aphidicola]QCI24450.1 ribosome maturation factor RimM [Buchnera aphidicola (Muscaphis stroyani)]
MINISIKKPKKSLIVGKVGKSYGILGWITIFSFTEKKEKIFDYLPWFFLKDNKWIQIYLKNWKKYNKNFIILIKNIYDRSTVMQFTNSDIIIDKNQLPFLKKNEYYWYDIINYQVINTNQIYLGQVTDLLRTKYNDILIVKNKKNKNNHQNTLIPFIEKKIIKKIDLSKKIIIVIWN